MRNITRLAAGPGFAIDDVHVRMHEPSWTSPEASTAYRLVFVRHGVFRLRVSKWELLADPATVYAVQAGDEQSIAHRVGANDTSTSVVLSPVLLADLTADRRSIPVGPMFTSGRVDLAHRQLLACARGGADRFELSDHVLRLAAALLDPKQCGPAGSTDSRGSNSRRRMVEAAREALVADPVSLGLESLARQVSVSPTYLSRVFRSETGQTLTRFRNRLRVRMVLDRIEAGESSLSRLAAELGFADHAHLTRTVRDEVGCTPSAVRGFLGPRPVPAAGA
ncbi:helix-turn-helix transcriptional regulator [Solihabitans fulvus]|uniref:Helix-turn-helix transcriptional regulator n=1 Tax=Solihabitans fulvus TaxID=1892852 RepID=A0A5B2WPG9_9PSEU|nr:helix-turn-helix transcriptional regulator [Solihabitans fulvus]KAA2252828.1 helix-turn-helix transcriptional regulator [Solihabitans fulvus]